MEDVNHIEMRILSQPRYCCVVRAAVESIAGKLGLPEKQRDRLGLAVDEALTNTMRHGYRGQTDQPIWIRIDPFGDNGTAGIQIVIEDRSVGVNPDDIQDRVKAREAKLGETPGRVSGTPSAGPADIQPGGLGVHIIHEAADEVRFEKRIDGDGMRLVLRKYIDSGQIK